jgi:hypothetical protein
VRRVPPPPIADRIGEIAPLRLPDRRRPRHGWRIRTAGEVLHGGGQPKEVWKVPAHRGPEAQPADYERSVVEFYDRALLGK